SLVLDLYNPAAPTTTSPGHVTVVVADDLGGALSSTTLAAVEEYLSARCIASVTVHVVNPTYTSITFTASVVAASGYTAADAKAAGEAALRAWLNPATWNWSASASPFDAAGILSQVPAIASVTTITGGGSLAKPGPLAKAGTITVNAT